MNRSVRLVHLFGVDIAVQAGWAVAFVFLTVVLVFLGLPGGASGGGPVEEWALAAAGTVLVFVSILFHETVHALAARRLGIAPAPVSLFLGAGGATSLDRAGARPVDELLIALSGPLASVAVALVLGAATVLLDAEAAAPALVNLGLLTTALNGLLGVFNLVPAFPLDGGRILRAILWRVRGDFLVATRETAQVSRIVGWIGIGAGVAIAVLNDPVTGLTVLVLGWFLTRFGTSASRWATIERHVEGVSVGQVMEREAPTVRPTLTLDVFVQQYLSSGAGSGFVVTSGEGGVDGTIDVEQARRVPRSQWTERRIADVMVPRGRVETAREEDPLWPVIQRFERARLHVMPVLDGERLIGVLTREGLLAAIRRRAQLGQA